MHELLVILSLLGLENRCEVDHSHESGKDRLEVTCPDIPLEMAVRACERIDPIFQPPYRVYMIIENGNRTFYCSQWENYKSWKVDNSTDLKLEEF